MVNMHTEGKSSKATAPKTSPLLSQIGHVTHFRMYNGERLPVCKVWVACIQKFVQYMKHAPKALVDVEEI